MSARSLKKITLFSMVAWALVVGSAAPAQRPATPPTAKTRAKARTAAKAETTLDLNSASAESMAETLPGVGEATARKIVAGRPYTSVDDLARAGVSARTIAEIRRFVTVTPPPTTKVTAKEKVKTMIKREAGDAAGKPASTGKVDLNHATVEELETLPGVGPAHAREIIAARPFRSTADLSRLRGLGRSRVAELLPRVTVTPVAPPATAETTPAPKSAARPAMTRPAAGTARAPARITPGKPVNINTATREELDVLPGIGPVKAQAIIEARPFKTKEDVMKVKGIKQGEFGKIKDLITVE